MSETALQPRPRARLSRAAKGPPLKLAIVMMMASHAMGTFGYWLLGQIYREEPWPIIDCFYMTVITVTTVGYGEYIDVHSVPHGWVFTSFVILVMRRPIGFLS